MKKKMLCTLLAALLGLSLLAGCSQGGSDGESAGDEAQTATSGTDADASADVQDGEGPEVELGALLDEAVPLADAPNLDMLGTAAPGTKKKANENAVIDYSNAADGYVMVSWLAGAGSGVKVLVKGPSGTTYQYNLRTDGTYEAFPLSDGSGTYEVGVYRNTSGTKYATIITESVPAQLKDEFAPFIRPNQYVYYSENSEAVKKAKELCDGAGDNLAKVERVYNFVIGHVTYDKVKAQSVKSGYLPDIDETLSTGKGICFDYASLMAAMLRSQGVPVKLVLGYTDGAYHAWISVWSEKDGWIEGKIYFNGTEWKLMDPTFASSSNNSDSILEYIGNGENYTAKYLY